MTTLHDRCGDADLAGLLAHVRWIAGGTGAGKSTLARMLAEWYDVTVYAGDQAEREYVARCTPQRQPFLTALLGMSREQFWLGRTLEENFATMPSLHGETFGFVLDDVLDLPADRPVLVDDMRTLPGDVASLLSWPEQAVFLIPTPEFRHRALASRYADPARARANWGDCDHERVFANRLARDALWDAEIRRQADRHNLPVIHVDGAREPADLAAELAERLRLAA